ncbi:MAG: glycosyltransferase [Weeksellaceae bacterium]
MKKVKKLNVFFFGNIPVKEVPASYGGATVLAEEMLDFIRENDQIEVKHSPIRFSWKPKHHILDHILWVFKFPFAIRNQDIVSFHTTWDFNFTTAPLVWLWAKILGKRTIYHFFGGNFHFHYQKIPNFLKFIYDKTLLSSDIVFFETKELIDYFESKGIVKGEWLPNARKPVLKENSEREFRKRFVFISRVIPDKGINEIIAAAEKLNSNYTIDIYGPIDERFSSESSFEGKKANYKGLLQPQEVLEVLNQYDVLLLPTWFGGEGYPGIIIEALSLGIPSITTQWISIPEIIQDEYNGKLIEIKNSEELYQAILSFDESNYKVFCKNALDSFEQFNSDQVFMKIINAYLNE